MDKLNTSGRLYEKPSYSEDSLTRICETEHLKLLNTKLGAELGRQYCQHDVWDRDDALALLMGFAPSKGDKFLDIAKRQQGMLPVMRDAVRLADMMDHAEQVGALQVPLIPINLLLWIGAKRFPGDQLFVVPELLTDELPGSSLIATLNKTVEQLNLENSQLKSDLHTAKETIKSQKLATVKTLKTWLYGMLCIKYTFKEVNEQPRKYCEEALLELSNINITGDDETFRTYITAGMKAYSMGAAHRNG